MGSLPRNTYALLTVDQERGETLFPLTAEHLERGVLLGRYDRCEVELWGMCANAALSRVHLLLLKEVDAVLAIDTASSFGTKVNEKSVTVTELPKYATIELAGANELLWSTAGESELSIAPKPEPVAVFSPAVSPKAEPQSKPKAEPEPEPNPEPEPELPPVLSLVLPHPRARAPIPPPEPKVRVNWDFVVPRWRWSWNTISVLLLLAIVCLIAVVDALWPRTRAEPAETREMQECIHPIDDLGTDSPALRLFLQQQSPDVCFDYKWTPEVQEVLDEVDDPSEEPGE